MTTNLQVSAQKQLKQLVEAIERLNEEQKGLAGDVREKYDEAKGLGFDPKIIRKVVALRKKTKSEREEEDAILATYLHAVGFDDTPLGKYGQQRGELATV